jgi:hypothetical protein
MAAANRTFQRSQGTARPKTAFPPMHTDGEVQMKHGRLLSMTTVGMLLGHVLVLGAASAQTDKPAEAASPPPAAIQNAPPDKIAPSMKAGQPDAETHKAPETVGQPPNMSDGDKTRAVTPDANGSDGSDGSKK